MAYNLPSALLSSTLLNDDDGEENLGTSYSENEDSEYLVSEDDSESTDNIETEACENIPLENRLPQRSVGRPVTKLTGKNGYSWDKRAFVARTSGKTFLHSNSIFSRVYISHIHLSQVI